MTRALKTPTLVIALLLISMPSGPQAATCRWNNAEGLWTDPASWQGCATGNGNPAGTPGTADTARIESGSVVLPNGTRTVGTLVLNTGTRLTHAPNQFATLITAQGWQWNGGLIDTEIGSGVGGGMTLIVDTAATGALGAESTLGRNARIENRGRFEMLAAPAANRIQLQGEAEFTHAAGSTLVIGGTAEFLRSGPATNTAARVNLMGEALIQGPGTLSINGEDGSNRLLVELRQGRTTVRNATVSLGDGTARLDLVYADTSNPVDAPSLVMDNANLQFGGASYFSTVPAGARLSGTGTLQASLNVLGTLDPGGLEAPPYGTLQIGGNLAFANRGRLHVDIGGSALAQRDHVQAASLSAPGSAAAIHLDLKFSPQVATPLGAVFPLIGYGSVSPTSEQAVNLITANVARDFATRFSASQLSVVGAPRLLLSTVHVPEGSSGSAVVQVPVRLSEPASFETRVKANGYQDGSAVRGGANPDYSGEPGDLLVYAPGQTQATIPATIIGDTQVEANEQFTAQFRRRDLVDVAAGNGVPGNPTFAVTIATDELPADTRYVLLAGGGAIRRLTTEGLQVDIWPFDGSAPAGTTGMCFGPDGVILATRFDTGTDASGLALFARDGGPLKLDFGAPHAPNAVFPESCVFDRHGNVYVGHAGLFQPPSPDINVPILKYSRYGQLLDRWVIPTGERGTDWIDLGGDGCTLYYTSEDSVIRRYDLCAREELEDLITGLEAPCFALRRRANSETMVACRNSVYRISPDGAILREYPRADLGESDPNGLFALNLDPDGTSFWTAGIESHRIVRVDIESGSVLTSFVPPDTPGVANGGLAVYEELFGFEDLIFEDGLDP